MDPIIRAGVQVVFRNIYFYPFFMRKAVIISEVLFKLLSYLVEMSEFQKIGTTFVSLIDDVAKEVEKEKMMV